MLVDRMTYRSMNNRINDAFSDTGPDDATSSITGNDLADKVEHILRVLQRRSPSVFDCYCDQLHELRDQCRSNATQIVEEFEILKKAELRLFELVNCEPEIKNAYDISTDVQLLHILSSNLKWFEELRKQRGLSRDEESNWRLAKDFHDEVKAKLTNEYFWAD